MVQFFKPQAKEVSTKHFLLNITDIDLKGRGVGKCGNITWFVNGALSGEDVVVRATDLKKNIGEAELICVKKTSPYRIKALCPYFGKCGGCSLQNMSSSMQLDIKVQGLKRLFRKQLGCDFLDPEQIIDSQAYEYRRVCRLSVLGNRKEIHLGFHPLYGNKLVEIDSCPILESKLNDLLPSVRELVKNFSNYKIIGHIELYSVDSGVVVLLRVINSLSQEDKDLCIKYAQMNNLSLYIAERCEKKATDLEEKEIVYPLYSPISEKPYYFLDDKKISFTPGAFIQINKKLNEKMVEKCLEYLNIDNNDEIFDLFSGVGNFSVPIAEKAKYVIGVECVWSMVEEAKQNAKNNGVDNLDFFIYDLEDDFEKTRWAKYPINKVCLDPGRKGALKVISYLIKKKVKTIVYVSCNPLSFSRDLSLLLNNGYRVVKWCVFNVFPNTEHVESMFLITKDN
ncbi:MAG: 23S rRNA (uracil(1939)-C(5))-methyltransferase RlmD [Succinivibrionaceae bacterium]